MASVLMLSGFFAFLFLDMHSFRNDNYKSYELPNELSEVTNNIRVMNNVLLPSVELTFISNDSFDKLKKEGIVVTDTNGDFDYKKL